MTITVPLFVNGDGMRGGRVHHTIQAHPFLGAARPSAEADNREEPRRD